MFSQDAWRYEARHSRLTQLAFDSMISILLKNHDYVHGSEKTNACDSHEYRMLRGVAVG